MILMPESMLRIMGDLEEGRHFSLDIGHSWRHKWAHRKKMPELRVKYLL